MLNVMLFNSQSRGFLVEAGSWQNSARSEDECLNVPVNSLLYLISRTL